MKWQSELWTQPSQRSNHPSRSRYIRVKWSEDNIHRFFVLFCVILKNKLSGSFFFLRLPSFPEEELFSHLIQLLIFRTSLELRWDDDDSFQPRDGENEEEKKVYYFRWEVKDIFTFFFQQHSFDSFNFHFTCDDHEMSFPLLTLGSVKHEKTK